MTRPPRRDTPRPTRQQILEYLRDNPGKVGKREIARAFQISGDDRLWLKSELKALAEEGLVARGRGRRMTPAGMLPAVAVLDVVDSDVDGELLGRPSQWRSEGPPPKVVLVPTGRGLPAVGRGDRVLAKLERISDRLYEARVIRSLDSGPQQVVGLYTRSGREGRVQPADKRSRNEYVVRPEDAGGAMPGEVVVADILPGQRHGGRAVQVRERLGALGDPRSLSLIAIEQHGLPTRFSAEARAEAKAARPVRLGSREDLRPLPLVTIDPEDARDHDDAVFAEADDDPANPGGWHLVVAIADVSWYVRPGSALDRDARQRGNSTYFPDRVVPMLPEELSTDLCSLVEGKSRACLAVHVWLDRDGNKLRHRFSRALMRSRASLSYGQAQAARDGRPEGAAAELVDTVIAPLFGAYDALAKARELRQPLAIELPERKVEIGEDGYIKTIRPRERYDAHRLIEEYMILANVCAAESLEGMRQPCMYRVHDEPARDKLVALREFLGTLGFTLPPGQVLRPAAFNRVLRQASGTPHEHLVNEVVLRTQMQAIYSPENHGHFGLNLQRYAHFTSPIRRYADLLVHRALVTGGRFGAGGLSPFDLEHFQETAELISGSERRSMAAEREAMDRFTAAFMAGRVGGAFVGRISGVTRFGLFIKLEETGADGLVPISSLGADYFVHDEAQHALIGRNTGAGFRLGDVVEVKLAEADVVTGGLRLEMLQVLGAPAPLNTTNIRRRRGLPRGAQPKRQARPPRRGR